MWAPGVNIIFMSKRCDTKDLSWPFNLLICHCQELIELVSAHLHSQHRLSKQPQFDCVKALTIKFRKEIGAPIIQWYLHQGQMNMNFEKCWTRWINLSFGRWGGCRWCPGWRRWPAGKLCYCPSPGRPAGIWMRMSMVNHHHWEWSQKCLKVLNLMAVVGELWSTRVCKDLARTTATSRRSISRNVKNPSVRLWREKRWSFVLWRNQFHIHLEKSPFLIHLWRKAWPRVGALVDPWPYMTFHRVTFHQRDPPTVP